MTGQRTPPDRARALREGSGLGRLLAGPGTLALFGALAIVGHGVGIVADVYSGYSPGVAVELGPVTSLSLANIGPLLAEVSLADARIGHYLAVCFIPLGIFGVWQVFIALRPAAGSLLFLVLGTLCVAYGTFYHGTLAFLTGALQGLWDGTRADPELSLVTYFNGLSEPLGQVLLFGNLFVSALYAFLVGSGRSRFPRWFAAVNPVIIQLGLSVVILLAPRPVDRLLWLTVFNTSFVAWYGATTAYLVRLRW